ncbi:GerAB/ArcD/ProY family transporter [Bacillus sp. B15-48]|uniref:GerAB/ArcD/ProY family transporter n=1 Tax=Bacillus sp. B15-48 TaxID=1548601 RepID=UPI00193F09D6|nr:GerAB/ArcD/ProY family transporter [Bacillus sp. B15-48]MBM4760770.1 GerAB/ArcD/ProY family transporter [Bacillus sp. B15-48]
MQGQGQVPERVQISPFIAAYVIVAMQIGIGVLGFQRLVAKDAEYDAWISVLAAGLSIHLLVWMMYKICEMVEGDAVYANVFAFGKIIGNIINLFFIFFYLLSCVTVLGGLIEVIEVWMFEDLNRLLFGAVFLILGVYIVNGGFRSVAGIAFFSVVLPSYLMLTFGYTFKHADFSNLFPILDHTPGQLLKSGYNMSLTYLGYGVLLFFYPFIKKPQKSKKWVHLGILITTLLYTSLTLVTFMYFSLELLDKSIWATLEMWKIVQMPFIERFEYIGIANWAIIIIPNVAISLWASSRIAKRVFNVKQKKAVLLISIACLIIVLFLNTRERMTLFLDFQAKLGFILAYGYTPFLYFSVMIAKKVKKK